MVVCGGRRGGGETRRSGFLSCLRCVRRLPTSATAARPSAAPQRATSIDGQRPAHSAPAPESVLVFGLKRAQFCTKNHQHSYPHSPAASRA